VSDKNLKEGAMKFKPLGNRVLVERVDEPEKTPSGIIIPDNAKEKPLEGNVLAIGPEVEEEGHIKVGDRVVFAKYSGTDITLEGKEYLILQTDDILGILEK
jgi:chaperonin GroES